LLELSTVIVVESQVRLVTTSTVTETVIYELSPDVFVALILMLLKIVVVSNSESTPLNNPEEDKVRLEGKEPNPGITVKVSSVVSVASN
jgi:hypothetical protein